MQEYNCWKCGSTSRMADNTKMVGGYNARLCLQCCNDFNEFVTATPEWRDLLDNDARLNVAVEQADEEKTVRVHRERTTIVTRLYAISKAWAPAPVPEPKKTETNVG